MPGQVEMTRVINSSWTPLRSYLGSSQAQQLILSGQSGALLGAMPWGDWLYNLEPVQMLTVNNVRSAIKSEMKNLPGIEARSSFNVIDQISQRYGTEYSGRLIKNLSDTSRSTVRQLVGEAMSGQRTVDSTARALRSSIGLHPAWASAVAKTGDRAYVNAIKNGLTEEKARAFQGKAMEQHAKKLTRRRAENIARTEIQTASNVGTWATWEHAVANGYAERDSRKEWNPGPGACGICAPLSGEIVAWDEPFSNGNMMPPGHPSCLPGTSRIVMPADIGHGLSLTVPASGGFGDTGSATATAVAEAVGNGSWEGLSALTVRDYVGDFVTIETKFGKKLTITPNHPVATVTGWKRAGEILVGDNVLSSVQRDRGTGGGPNIEDVEAPIEKVFNALPVALSPMPVTAQDFHGEGSNSNVYVVRSASLLGSVGDPQIAQSGYESQLMSAGDSEGVFSCLGPLHQLLPFGGAALSRSVSVLREVSQLFGAQFAHPGVHSGGTIAGGDSRAEQVTADNIPADAEGFCQSLLASTGEVTADEVINVQRERVHTQVYNCNTTDGWYLADGIVVHNCRCSASLLPSDFTPDKIDWTNADRHKVPKKPTQKPKVQTDPLKMPPPSTPSVDLPPPPGYTPKVEPRTFKTVGGGEVRELLDSDMPVAKGDPLGITEAVKGANPARQSNVTRAEFDDKMFNKYQNNCSSCANAYELRRRGWNVQAGDTGGIGRKDSDWISSRWNDPETGNVATATRFWQKSEIKDWAKDQPVGSRGFLSVTWTRGGGHALNWEKGMSNGKEVFRVIDPQTGETYALSELSRKVSSHGMAALRTDNLVPNQNVLQAIVKEQS